MDGKVDPTEGELMIIARMLKQAEAEGLTAEVVWSLVCNVRAGEKDIAQAACAALYDWDI